LKDSQPPILRHTESEQGQRHAARIVLFVHVSLVTYKQFPSQAFHDEASDTPYVLAVFSLSSWNTRFQQTREKSLDMKNQVLFGTALAVAVLAPTAMADFEVAYDMSDVAVEDGAFVYGEVSNEADYVGRTVLGIGVRNLEILFNAESEVQFAWAMDLTAAGYGAGIFIFSSDGPFPVFSVETFSFEFDISGYGGVIADEGLFSPDWNAGTFLGSGGVNNAFTALSGEMYYILEGDPVPAPGALALLGLAGIVARRRRA
jgi:MYXO-CTERM domain-containing protein